jgi:hypothetical protein
MAEITIEKLNQLLGSAKANKADVITWIKKEQAKAAELIASYDGAIGVLQLLLDDMQAQTTDALSLDEFQKLMPEGITVEGIHLHEKKE